MFLDLDNFKQVNDSLGHTTGDKLLGEIARRLGSIVGPRDLVARWGGDEFVILHRHGAGQLETPALARRIIDEIGRAVVIDGSEVIVGASIGTASAPDDGATPDVLLSNADIALYAAKADGRRGWRAFEREMDTKIQVRRLIELELRAAVANDAIDVHFQPIVDVMTRRIVAFEALARWRHPVRGAVSPAEFIPIVEEIGLMEEFGACVLRRACRACAAWPRHVSVSVNLSPSQFRSGNIEAIVEATLSASGLRPDRLDLEITESTLLDDRGDARGTLDALRARGCRISLDDFGTGYSSLSYLLSFPLDRVKIDRSFTVGLGIHERASILVESVACDEPQARHDRADRRRRDRTADADHRATRNDRRGAGLPVQPAGRVGGGARAGRSRQEPQPGGGGLKAGVLRLTRLSARRRAPRRRPNPI